MSHTEGKSADFKQPSHSPQVTPQKKQKAEMLKENLSIGFRSLNDSVQLLQDFKILVQEQENYDR